MADCQHWYNNRRRLDETHKWGIAGGARPDGDDGENQVWGLWLVGGSCLLPVSGRDVTAFYQPFGELDYHLLADADPDPDIDDDDSIFDLMDFPFLQRLKDDAKGGEQ